MQVVERLGTETHVVVGIDAPRLRSRALQDAIDAAPDDDVLLAEDDRASFTVVTEARTPVAVGDSVELGLDPARLQGFDAETGEALGPPVEAAARPRVDDLDGQLEGADDALQFLCGLGELRSGGCDLLCRRRRLLRGG